VVGDAVAIAVDEEAGEAVGDEVGPGAGEGSRPEQATVPTASASRRKKAAVGRIT
jgi:hypothetical protein